MNICVISPSYPTQGKHSFPFVENLCNTWANLGHNVTVITPVRKLNRLLKRGVPIPYKQNSYQAEVGSVMVYTPEYYTIGNTPIISERFNFWSIRRCIKKTIEEIDNPIDVVYAHFWRCGLYVFDVAKKHNLPLFVATGESQIKTPEVKHSYLRDFSNYVKGVICVSTKNKKESLRLGLTQEEKCIILPNAIDSNYFHLKDKRELRNKLGFDESSFIVAFVGYFIKRKGPKRVSDAIDMLNNDKIKSIFIGTSANQEPELPGGNSIVFQGVLPHEKISDYLNCADVFVLPTLHEGCCNAIIEAMSCGLPIISSDREFNYDVLNESNSILVDPEDIQQISKAINCIYLDKEIRESLSKGALKKAESLDIIGRAKSIVNFIKEKEIK